MIKPDEEKLQETTKDMEDDGLLDLLDEVSDKTEPVSKEEAKPAEVKPVQAEIVEPENLPLPFIELTKKFNSVVSKVIKDADADRNSLDELAQHAKATCMAYIQSNEKPQAAMVEAWTNALSKKAETNIAMTKLLDSIAKLLSAGKNSDIFIQVNNADTESDLRKLLDSTNNQE